MLENCFLIFAVMMKARQYDQRVLTRNIEPKLYSIQESDSLSEQQIDAFCISKELKAETAKLVTNLKNAKELGSIIQLPPIDFEIIKNRIKEIKYTRYFVKFNMKAITFILQ